MKSTHLIGKISVTVLGAGAAMALLLGSNDVYAKKPPSASDAEDQRNMLMAAVKKGDDLWHSGALGTNGLGCANCHPDAAATNPHTWPKYQTNLGKVGTLRDMINWCIAVPLQGKPLALDSTEMVAMEAYATYMHRGIAIAPGKDEQNGGVPVHSGPGYPTGNDGNR